LACSQEKQLALVLNAMSSFQRMRNLERQQSIELYQNLRRARTFMDDCYYLPLDLAQISSKANFSRYHFIRLFRKTYGQTPHQYLTYRRIEKAKNLLRTSELSVTEICFAVGFQSLGSFSSLFYKYVGNPPKSYRARIVERIPEPKKSIPACFTFMFGLDSADQKSNFQEAKN